MRGIPKRYGTIQMLEDVSLDLMPGEVLGLVGGDVGRKFGARSARSSHGPSAPAGDTMS